MILRKPVADATGYRWQMNLILKIMIVVGATAISATDQPSYGTIIECEE